jgi:hypothetical protein
VNDATIIGMSNVARSSPVCQLLPGGWERFEVARVHPKLELFLPICGVSLSHPNFTRVALELSAEGVVTPATSTSASSAWNVARFSARSFAPTGSRRATT